VAGTEFASRALTRRIVRARRRDFVSSSSPGRPLPAPLGSDVGAGQVTMAPQEVRSQVTRTSS
jgi:hypothetical protein